MSKVDLSVFKDMSKDEMTDFFSKLPQEEVTKLAENLCGMVDNVASAFIANKDVILTTNQIPESVLKTLPKMDSNNE